MWIVQALVILAGLIMAYRAGYRDGRYKERGLEQARLLTELQAPTVKVEKW